MLRRVHVLNKALREVALPDFALDGVKTGVKLTLLIMMELKQSCNFLRAYEKQRKCRAEILLACEQK